MENTIPDLWGDDINIDVLTPIMILNSQSELLRKKTKGLIVPTIEQTLSSSDVVLITFYLLQIKHSKDLVYPALVTAKPLQPDSSYSGSLAWGGEEDNHSILALTQNNFVKLLEDVFKSPYIQSIIQSIIAKANESKLKSDSDNDPNREWSHHTSRREK